MIQGCPSINSEVFQKGITFFPVHLRSRKCNLKLYMIHVGAISRGLVFRISSMSQALHVRGTYRRNQAASISSSNNVQRREPFDDDLEVKLQELFAEIKSMIKMGKKADALDLLQANYEAVKELMDAGYKGVEEAAILDVIALGYMATGDLKIVESLLDMLNEVVKGLGDDEPLVDSILMHMGSMYSAVRNFDNSMLMYKRVLETLERKNGRNSTSLVTALLGMGKVLSLVGRASKAVTMYTRAINILESNKGAESKELVVPLFALGNLLTKEGKAADAENHFTRIVNIYTKLYGEDDERVGMAMSSLANAKCAQGNADEAILLYRNALRVLKSSKRMAVDDGLLEKMRIDLAELLHVVGREREGRELLEECLLVTEKCRGKEDPSLVNHLVNLATSYSRSKNFAEAERLLRISLQIMKKAVGPDDPSITFPMLQLAITLYNLKWDEEAEQLALRVLKIREKAFGEESLPVGEALDCLISIQNRLEKDEGDVVEMLKRILRIQEKAFGNESEEVIETLKKIVFYLDKMGIKDQKFPLERRLSMLRNKYKQKVPYQ